jgi:hypothetical protein
MRGVETASEAVAWARGVARCGAGRTGAGTETAIAGARCVIACSEPVAGAGCRREPDGRTRIALTTVGRSTGAGVAGDLVVVVTSGRSVATTGGATGVSAGAAGAATG